MSGDRHKALAELQEEVGATSFTLVRQRKHLIVDFHFADIGAVRFVCASSPSDRRSAANNLAWLRRKVQARRDKIGIV